MVVAIDGPAGTGKSTVAQRVAEETGFLYLNSGKFYRAITYKALKQGKRKENRHALIATAADITIDVTKDAFFVDGVQLDRELHSEEIDTNVAEVSSIPEVRISVNSRIKKLAQEHDLVVEGRDMQTTVFPNAEVKVFLDADVKARARRRYEQNKSEGDLKDIEAAIRRRDEIDQNKQMGKLARAEDALYVDTTDLTIEEVCETVIATIQKKRKIAGVVE
ncbi:MAG: (d)CMP kinase [Alkalispirochaetaceae bacterium]